MEPQPHADAVPFTGEASVGLPQAKTAVPRQPRLVRRDRLLAPLRSALTGGRTALIVAPGGAGKTSLVAGWAATAPLPVAWYALDLADRDPRRLLAGLSTALDRALPGAMAPAREALARGDGETAVLDGLLGALEDRPVVLVLDDFHHLDGADEVSSLFEQLFRLRPARFALAILSRTIPLLGLSGLTALDAVVGLGQADLRFDLAESRALLAAHGLPPDDAARHLRRAGGWAAGVLLLGRTGRAGEWHLLRSSERLLEQLCGEVVAALPPDQRAFLLESAALGPVGPQAADAILGRQDSGLRFAQAAADGLFVEQQGDSYRYHDLFADYLVRRLARERPAALAALQEAAARWWVAHGDVPAALALLARGEQWAALAGLLEREQAALGARGLWGTILDHLARLPAALQTPRLVAIAGFAHAVRGEHAQALALAERGMAMSGEPAAWLIPAVLKVQALALAGRYREALLSVDEVLPVARAEARVGIIARLHEMAGLARCRLGRAGREDLQRAIALYGQAGDQDGALRSRFQLATMLIEAGQARAAVPHLEEAATYWEGLGNRAMLASVANDRALLRLLTGDTAAAYTLARQALEQARAAGYPTLEVAAAATVAEVAAECDYQEVAVQAAEEALAGAVRLGLGSSGNAARRAQIAVLLVRRERGAARRQIDAARAAVHSPVDAALLDLADGQLALRSLANARAAALLAAAAEQLAALDRPHLAARALLCLAEAQLRLGHIGRATAALNRLAGLVEGLGCEGYVVPAARWAPLPLAQRRVLRHLHRRARLLLDLVAAGPGQRTAPRSQAGPPPNLRLSPFGQGAAWIDGAPLDLAALRLKAQELLFYSAHAGADLPRDSLLEAVWAGDAGSRQALWNAGRDLRRLLGERTWGPRGGRYGLRLGVDSDERRFEACARVALGEGPAPDRLAAAGRALALLGDGTYLPWCESAWAAAARDRLAALGLQVALAAAPLAEALGRPEAAVEAIRQAIALDPLGEEPRALLIGLLIRLGQPAQARAEYEGYRALLAEEVGEAPGAAVRALLADRGGDTTGVPRQGPRPARSRADLA